MTKLFSGSTGRVSRAALAAAMFTCVATSAQAQDGEPAEDAGEADSASRDADPNVIFVTAQFREQNLQDTPLAITAVSGAMLEERSQTNIAQVANQAPSVTLRTGNANFGPSLAASIRGIGQFDFNPALEPGVGLYVDEVYYPTLTGSVFDLLDLDRVEILRGPQGTLAGRNSIGGAIKLYSKRPEGSNIGSLSVAYGSRDRIDLRGNADFGISEGVDLRVSAVSKQQDGYVDRLDFGCVNPPGSPLNPADGIPGTASAGGDCVIARDGNVDYQAVRGQLRIRPTDTLDINFIADYSIDDRNPAAAVLTSASDSDSGNPAIRGQYPNVPFDERFICGPYCNYGTYETPADPAYGFPFGTDFQARSLFEGWGISGQVDWELDEDLQLVSITAYREYEARFGADDDLSPLPVSNIESDIDFRFFSQELRLNGSLADDAVEYTVGGYYSDQRSIYAASVDLRWAGLQFAQNDPVPAQTKAVFAHGTWNVTDAFALNLGARYTDESKDYTFPPVQSGWIAQPAAGGSARRHRGRIFRRASRLPHQCPVSLDRQSDDLRAVLDRLQGRRGQSPAILRIAGPAVRDGNHQGVGNRPEERFVR